MLRDRINSLRLLIEAYGTGPLQEAKKHQFKGSKFATDDGTEFSVERVVAHAKSDPKYFKKGLPTKAVEHDLEWWDKNPEQTEKHMKTVDTRHPILVIKGHDGHLSVADGLNRLKKATSIEGRKDIDAYVVPMKDIAHLGKKGGKKPVLGNNPK